MLNKLMKMALAATLAFMQVEVLAEDIDLFNKAPGTGASPNVLIVLDNSSNWSSANQAWPTDTAPPVACGNDCNKQGYYELKAIRTVINGLPTDSSGNVAMNVGLMMFNNSTATRDGGYVRHHVSQLTAANKAAFIATLDQIITNFNTETAASSVQYGAALFDAFKYFGGHTNPASNTSAPPANPTYDSIPVFGTQFWGSNNADGSKPATAAYSGSNYIPIAPSACGRNFIVFIGNGFPAKDDVTSSNMGEVLRKLTNPSNPPATISEFLLKTVTPNYSAWANTSSSCTSQDSCVAAKPADTTAAMFQCVKSDCSGNSQRVQTRTVTSYTTTTAVPSGNAVGRYADEFTDFLRRTDVNAIAEQQNITTYTIDVYKAQQDADQTALMRSMATYGGGKYFAATNEAALKTAFTDIFSEIQSVNTAFSSASLPVSVNVQGRYLNQVFVGMFRPETTPKWFGNLKQYQFRADVDSNGKIVEFSLADADNKPIRNSQNSFIQPCARSFWTPSVADTYWAIDERGSCVIPGSRASNSPDGDVVEKGGSAFKLRGVTPGNRNTKTCADITCGGLVNFDISTGPSATDLGVSSTDRNNLINWVRGQNVDAELIQPSTSAMRPSVHGDVVHSRPLAIDYGGTTGVVVFYGGNDGMLRAIKGGKTGSTDGNELWSFVAPAHYSKLSRLKLNSPDIAFPNASSGAKPKDYFFDGPIGFYRSGTTAWIYPTMRRGGREVYAFDVSTPATPTLKWKRGAAELVNIGQTWSEPKVVKVAGYTTNPVIIMGGGYDLCEDADVVPNTTCGTPEGNRIFVLDANTGTLLKTFTTDRSVVADITAVDNDGDGKVDMVYAVDTGANIYRIDIGMAAPGSWTMSKIAALGGATAASDRKFLHAPEVVTGAGFNAVLVGSGNRERPLLANQAVNVDNAFFMIKDDRSASPSVITTSSLVAIDPDAVLTTTQKADLALSTNKGWYLALGSGGHDKEQVVTSAVVLAGIAYFSTHTPTVPTACDNLGLARGYAVSYLDASASSGGSRFSTIIGGGLPPSPVAGIVTVTLTVTNSDGTTTTKKNPDGTDVTVDVPFVITDTTTVVDPKVNPSAVRSRVYWYIKQ